MRSKNRIKRLLAVLLLPAGLVAAGTWVAAQKLQGSIEQTLDPNSDVGGTLGSAAEGAGRAIKGLFGK